MDQSDHVTKLYIYSFMSVNFFLVKILKKIRKLIDNITVNCKIFCKIFTQTKLTNVLYLL